MGVVSFIRRKNKTNKPRSLGLGFELNSPEFNTLPLNPSPTFQEMEARWQAYWHQNGTYRTKEPLDGQPKTYVLDMFPYPSGAGLHVGHPLGYIASDVVARLRRMQGHAVLHPMGFDAFGLPAEQYAIQTGQHPRTTTVQNSARYREQLGRLGFSFDWDRQIDTSDSNYYRWTQWMFLRMFDSWFDNEAQKARPIVELENYLSQNGNQHLQAACSEQTPSISAQDWAIMDERSRRRILMHYRLAYRAMARVNWCPALGTVLANDEVKDGFSERGGHPVEQRLMPQWMLRISAYADRLLEGMDQLQWSESIKEHQRHWIGRSVGAQVRFETSCGTLEVFTTRPDTLFGVSFVVVAPEHPWVERLTTPEQTQQVQAYLLQTKGRSERDRQAETRKISGCFTGSYARHPITGQQVPVWTADYVLAGYGTGVVMGVPAGDHRDWNFATHFGLDIPAIFVNQDPSTGACDDRQAVLKSSQFLDGLNAHQAIPAVIAELQKTKRGFAVTRYRLRDAVFSRQRYWGEPVPMVMDGEDPYPLPDSALPLLLPDIDRYLPTADGEPPLARAKDWTWQGLPLETTTMPGWAGSSWYFLRYTDPQNQESFAYPEAMKAWGAVDLYIGGAEHATGHLLYARFWNHFLFDRGLVPFCEPFKRLVNQGMIQGVSEYVFRSHPALSLEWWNQCREAQGKSAPTVQPLSQATAGTPLLISEDWLQDLLSNPHTAATLHEYPGFRTSVDVRFVDKNLLDIPSLLAGSPETAEWQNAVWLNRHGNTGADARGFEFKTRSEVEKMSKSKRNVVNPDTVVEQYGADTLRLYELFLGPLEDAKPWDTQGIEGVYRFLQKVNRHVRSSEVHSSDPDEAALRILHRCLRRVHDGLERMALNTCISAMMIGMNEIQSAGLFHRQILDPYVRMLAPFAPHLAEELWAVLGHEPSIHHAPYPNWEPIYLEQDTYLYPVQHNGKVRLQVELPAKGLPEDLVRLALAHPKVVEWLNGRIPTKTIAVPGRIINMVLPNQP